VKFKTQTEYWVDTKTGKLRGEFEALYQDISDPWGCTGKVGSTSNDRFIELIFREGRTYSKILDIGCGQGALAKKNHNRNAGDVTGVDVSATAIATARNNYPLVNFQVFDIIMEDDGDYRDFDAVIFSQVLWYFVEDIGSVLQKTRRMCASDGILFVHQYFPSKQKYGKQIQGIAGLLDLMKTSGLLVVEQVEIKVEDGGSMLLGEFQKE
jgi:2-polyprenyl-3-methyl-5-hydroxy-6-metoxy-1,4-benzoquinol methylase